MPTRSGSIPSPRRLAVLVSAALVVASRGIVMAATIANVGGTLAYKAALGEQNSVLVDIVGIDVVVTESGPGVTLTSPLGSGCTLVVANSFNCGDAALVSAMKATLRDQDDLFDATVVGFPVYVNGGPDDDELIGGTAADLLTGRGGLDTLRGNLGADSLRGGGGADALFDNLVVGVPDGDLDVLICGAGVDTADAGPGDLVSPSCP